MKLVNVVIHAEAVQSYQKGIYEVTLSDVQDSDDAAVAQYKKYVEDQAISIAKDLAAALPQDPKPFRAAVRSSVQAAPINNNYAANNGAYGARHSNGPASPKALAYAHRLGYNGPDNISSIQCNQIINQLKVNKENNNYQQQPAQMPQQQPQQPQDYQSYDYPDDDQNY